MGRVWPSGSEIGLSQVGLALSVKIRVKFGSGWSGLFGRTIKSQGEVNKRGGCANRSEKL